MKRYRHLFLVLLVALISAAAVAIALAGQRAVAQQQDEKVKRKQDFRKQYAAEVSRSIRDLLTTITAERVSEMSDEPWPPDNSTNSAVALVGWVDGDKLVFPWDRVSLDARAKAFKQAIDTPGFAESWGEARQADFSMDYERAAAIYGRMSALTDRNQREFARLLLAGALVRSERTREGIDLYRDLLRLPSDVVDEFGHPLVLNKVIVSALLQKAPELERDVLDRVNQEVSSPAALSRSSEFLRPILEELQKSPHPGMRADAARTDALLLERIKQLERMRALPEARDLQEAFASKTLAPDVWRARKVANGETWLIGMTSARSGPQLVIAVRADEIRESIEKDREPRKHRLTGKVLTDIEDPGVRDLMSRLQELQFAPCEESGESLGDSLPGLCVRPPSVPVQSSWLNLPLLFYLALGFVGILELACLWLLWRDTRREVHLVELRSQFVSSVSHELKTPLTAIRMFAETLQMQVRATDGPKHAQYLEIIVSESERLTRLLNNVLDFSRIERGDRKYQMHVTALGEVVQSVARTMHFPLTAQGFDFRVDVSNEIPPTPVDRDAIEQAVLNLVSNAMKYSGGKRDIALSLRRQNGSALIQVADCGVGIPAEEQKRIFEKFYRVPTPENQSISGAGLGLALVAHIAHAHGGSVEVESAVGQGSTFSIRLPIAPEHGSEHDDRANGEES